ncbi:phage/plasmid primase, P4 family [Desulfovibrio oxyclinae]|uniref:phage/plasmid primase, P4 family n=1 Tax=Desulfovibrio oxyclinae TaxID=63560 RepID=UPI00037F69C5|nr:phage/plasmid primase, P4 family [Desulfovibrio oxyclinae]
MGWALDNLSADRRAEIARGLFDVRSEDGDWLNGLCPLHDDQTPSFGYNVADDVFKCMAGCSDSGDLIKLFSLVNGLDDREGFREFRDRFGGDAPPLAPRHARRKNEAPPIPQSVLDLFPPLPDELAQRFREVRGWSLDVIRRLDLRLQTHYRDKESGEPRAINSAPQRVVMPVWDANGQLRNLRQYKLPDARVKAKIISWGQGYGTARPYPSQHLIPKEGPLLLCEGEPDVICALSHGFAAMTLTANNVRKWSGAQLAPLRNRDVIICYDADRPGQEHARIAAGNIFKSAKSVRLLRWPDFMGRDDEGNWPEDHGQDLTDFFMRHSKTAKDLQELFATATAYEEQEEEQNSNYWRFCRFNKFKPRLLANQLLQDRPLLHDPHTSRLYSWNGQYWELFDEAQVKRMAINYLGEEALQSRVNDAAFQAKILATVEHGREVNDRSEWICLQNCMLNTVTGETGPHERDYLATVQLGVDFKPDSDRECSRWLSFLEETVQTPEAIMQLQEFAGYCLTREVRFGKCLLLLGPGSDGKSTFLKILRSLVGPENCSAVRFQDLDDQFQRVALYGKQLNISTEVGSDAMESSMFKALVTGDPVQAAFKHKDVFEFVPYCKLAFAANRLPRVLDNSDGFYRRVLPVQFKVQYLDGDPRQDKHLEEKLLAELDEIFLWALEGLRRLREQGSFTDCEETRLLVGDYKRLNNPVQAFIEECCEVGEGATVRKDEAYKAYREFCKDGGYKALSKENLFRDLKSTVAGMGMQLTESRPRSEGRKRVLSGIRVLSSGVSDG